MALAVGFTVGAEIDLIGYLAARYFGLKNYGVIYGVIFGVTIFGLGVAPFLAGLAYDALGNYDWAIAASGIGLLLSAVLFFIMRPFPERPASGGGVQDAD
ncbi:MAG: hypothetical protein ISN29_03070 [Gammaproteobacteria bacterium AqS3]|nr:hypothetical protein [Gammaproteobacteria bacterium AqS3]